MGAQYEEGDVPYPSGNTYGARVAMGTFRWKILRVVVMGNWSFKGVSGVCAKQIIQYVILNEFYCLNFCLNVKKNI